MSSNALVFHLVDVVLILIIVLLSLKAMDNNVLEELFNTTTVVGSILLASCFHKPFAKFIYDNITQNVSITFLNSIGIILVFLIFFAIGKFISSFILGLTSNVPKGTKQMVSSILLAFFRYFIIFSVVIYIFHSKTRILSDTKDKYSKGVVYRIFKDTGRAILNMSTSKKNLYYY